MFEEKEHTLVHKAIKFEMQEIESGRIKTKTLEELEKKYNVDNKTKNAWKIRFQQKTLHYH